MTPFGCFSFRIMLATRTVMFKVICYLGMALDYRCWVMLFALLLGRRHRREIRLLFLLSVEKSKGKGDVDAYIFSSSAWRMLCTFMSELEILLI